MKISDLPQNVVDELCNDYHAGPNEKVVLEINPPGASIELHGKTYILAPSEGFDYEDMVHYLGYINFTKLNGWDILGGPGGELLEKIDESKPAWLLYQYSGDSTYYVYQF